MTKKLALFMNVIRKIINITLLSIICKEYSRNFCFYGVAYNVDMNSIIPSREYEGKSNGKFYVLIVNKNKKYMKKSLSTLLAEQKMALI